MSENTNRKLTAEDFSFVQVDEKIYDQKFEGKPIGFFMDAWLRFKQNKASVLAAIIIIFIVLMAIFAPILESLSLGKGFGFVNFGRWVQSALTFLVISCPCAWLPHWVWHFMRCSLPSFFRPQEKAA